MRRTATARRAWQEAIRVGIVVSLVVALGAACGGGDEERQDTQPAPDVDTFQQGLFEDLPKLPGSEPFGPRSEEGDIVARSYRLTGWTPAYVVDFYEVELPPLGWRETQPIFRSDTEARGDWVNDEWRLEVSATSIPDRRAESADQRVTQYSLVLRPR